MKVNRVLIIFLFGLVILSGCMPNPAARKPQTGQTAPGVQVAGVAVGDLSRDELSVLLHQLGAGQYQPAINAGFDSYGQFTPGQTGRMLDVDATADKALTAPAGASLQPVYLELVPVISTDELRRATRIGAYTTRIVDQDPNRLHNIRLTADLINNTVLESGQEFSFNRATGEPTAARGFKEAGIFADGGKHELEAGGGMCQVSTTLYNAVLAAGLNIIERHPHSQPVNYVLPGQDATVYTDKDLRFVNTSRHVLVIRAFETDKRLTVDLWSLEK
jgi:vancomycin resistance protein YoaR